MLDHATAAAVAGKDAVAAAVAAADVASVRAWRSQIQPADMLAIVAGLRLHSVWLTACVCCLRVMQPCTW